MINISAGESTQSYEIDVKSRMAECTETFDIIIKSVTACGVAIGSNNTSTVMIKDNSSKTMVGPLLASYVVTDL